MGFEFRYTCSTIDRAIDRFESELEQELVDMLEGIDMEENAKKELIEYYFTRINDSFVDAAESVRSTNEEMRTEANDQIEYVEHQLSEATDDLITLREENVQLEREKYETL